MNAYRFTYDNGMSYVTSMNGTLEEARAYLLGTVHEQADERTLLRVVAVDSVESAFAPGQWVKVSPKANAWANHTGKIVKPWDGGRYLVEFYRSRINSYGTGIAEQPAVEAMRAEDLTPIK